MKDEAASTSPRPIFVTGLPRGGTTWVGRMIACHRDLEYLHEPFNPDYPTGSLYGLKPPHWWLHVYPEREEAFVEPVQRMVALRPRLWPSIHTASNWTERQEAWNHYRRSRRRHKKGARALIKDPIGFFSAEWLAARFRARVVVISRHPAAWVDSFIRAGWRQPRGGIRDQPRLYNGLLRPFREPLLGREETDNRLSRTCTTWNMFMHVIREYAKRHPDWMFVRHEDLSRDPVGGFRRLYDRLGLEFSPRCRKIILRHSMAPDNEARYTMESITRNSRRNLTRWRENLSPREIARVRELTATYWPDHYSEEEW